MDEIFALAVFVGCTDSSRGAERGASEELAALTAGEEQQRAKNETLSVGAIEIQNFSDKFRRNDGDGKRRVRRRSQARRQELNGRQRKQNVVRLYRISWFKPRFQ